MTKYIVERITPLGHPGRTSTEHKQTTDYLIISHTDGSFHWTYEKQHATRMPLEVAAAIADARNGPAPNSDYGQREAGPDGRYYSAMRL